MHRTLALGTAFHYLAAPRGARDGAALRSCFKGRTVVEDVLVRLTITSR